MVAFRHYSVSVVALLVLVLLGANGAYGLSIDSQLRNWGVTPVARWMQNVPDPSVIALLASALATGLLGRRVNRRITGI